MIMVNGFYRAGNNWMMGILQLEFGDTRHVKDMHLGHCLHPDPKFYRARDSRIIYMRRNLQDVAESIFRLRARFGIIAGSARELLEAAPVSAVCNRVRGKVLVDRNGCSKVDEWLDPVFLDEKLLTLEELYSRHVHNWEGLAAQWRTIKIVDYENLIHDPEKELDEIAEFIGRDRLYNRAAIDKRQGLFPLEGV